MRRRVRRIAQRTLLGHEAKLIRSNSKIKWGFEIFLPPAVQLERLRGSLPNNRRLRQIYNAITLLALTTV